MDKQIYLGLEPEIQADICAISLALELAVTASTEKKSDAALELANRIAARFDLNLHKSTYIHLAQQMAQDELIRKGALQ